MIAARMYEHREDVRDGLPASELTMGSQHLMSSYRVMEL